MSTPVDPTTALLAWFALAARDLPWRGSGDAYAVLVSEIMSQQTRIETVRDYWSRWMVAFPTIGSLAAAPTDDVMRMWAGLGYYRRARNLHACAQAVAASGGVLPQTAAELRELPGVGAYTAAAVASIVHDERIAAVDGNVSRVMARLYRIAGNPTKAAFRKAVERQSTQMLPSARVGDFNEAVMELGATICTPRSPECGRCPVAQWCAAFAEGDQAAFPEPKPRKAPRRQTRCCVVAMGPDGSVFVRMATTELLGGLWEFPTYETSALAEDAVMSELGFDGRPAIVGSVEHIFSHIRMTYEVLLVRVDGSARADGRWVSADSLALEGVSIAMRKVAGVVLAHAALPDDSPVDTRPE